EWDRIVLKALEKNRTLRYQSATDIRTDLQLLGRKQDRRADLRRRGLALGLVLSISASLVWYLLPLTRDQSEMRDVTFTRLTDAPGEELFPSLAPDGKSFLYASQASGNWDVYLQRVGGRMPLNLTRESISDDTQPTFSPDGERIAFRSEREGGGIFIM